MGDYLASERMEEQGRKALDEQAMTPTIEDVRAAREALNEAQIDLEIESRQMFDKDYNLLHYALTKLEESME